MSRLRLQKHRDARREGYYIRSGEGSLWQRRQEQFVDDLISLGARPRLCAALRDESPPRRDSAARLGPLPQEGSHKGCA